MGASWETLPAPSVRIMSPSSACAVVAVTASAKDWAYSAFLPLSLIGLRQRCSRDPFDRRFTGRIDVEHDERIGVVEGGGEFFHQIASAGIAVGLEDDVNLAEPALAGGGERGPDLGWMVAIVIDHADAAGLPLSWKRRSTPRN